MGGMWCKADKGPRPNSPKGPWNSAIARWTDHVRNVYRKPKTYRRPPRPPQKPTRGNERLTISPPRLISDQSSDGWRTATLTVPDAAPVPPPRKKRKRHADLARGAFSMGDLSGGPEIVLAASTLSLPDRGVLAEESFDSRGVHEEEHFKSRGVHAEESLDSRGVHAGDSLDFRGVHVAESFDSKRVYAEESVQSTGFESTFLVAPVIERLSAEEEVDGEKEENKENIEEEADDENDVIDMIIPIEKETMFSSRTLLQSNLGYIDKLSAISEASAESGFDDRADFGKTSNSEMSESAASSPDPVVVEMNELNREIRERTAISKAAWLRGILGEADDGEVRSARGRRGSLGSNDRPGDVHGDKGVQHDSLPTHAHLADWEADFTSPTPPPSPTNHSVLLELLRKHSGDSEPQFAPREESIFLTNTKTNIIYKTLSKDRLTEGYEVDVVEREGFENREGAFQSAPTGGDASNRVNDSSLTTLLTDYAFRTPRLVDSDVGLDLPSSSDSREFEGERFVSDSRTLQVSAVPVIVVSGVPQDSAQATKHAGEVVKRAEPVEKEESTPSSRKSSITDSLHEFEMSIYEMLNESKKNRDSSDEEESLKTVNVGTKK